jgi:hypothetical protein
LFWAQKRPSRCSNGQTSSEVRPGPANAPRSCGETIPPGHLAETRPRARRSQTALRATATHLLGGGEPEPTTQPKAADGRLLGGTSKRPPGGPLGRAGAPRSTSDAEPRQGPDVPATRAPGPGQRAHRRQSLGTDGDGRASLKGRKPMGASSSGAAATPNRSQRILWQRKALRLAERGKPTRAGWQHQAKAGGTRAQTARGYGPAATRERAVREGKASKGQRHRGRQTEPPPPRREQRGQPETWRTPWPVAGCNRPAGC